MITDKVSHFRYKFECCPTCEDDGNGNDMFLMVDKCYTILNVFIAIESVHFHHHNEPIHVQYIPLFSLLRSRVCWVSLQIHNALNSNEKFKLTLTLSERSIQDKHSELRGSCLKLNFGTAKLPRNMQHTR